VFYTVLGGVRQKRAPAVLPAPAEVGGH